MQKNYIEGYKINILDTLFQVSAKAWITVTKANALQMVIALAAIMIFIIGLTGPNLTQLGSFSDPNELSNYIASLISSADIIKAIPYFALGFGIIIVVSAWNTYFAFLAIHKTTHQIPLKFSVIFEESMHLNVFKLLGVGFLLYVLLVIGIVGSALLAQIHGILTFLAIVFCFVAMFKFFLIIPLMLIENLSLEHAIRKSFEQITWLRALKLFGVSMLAFFAVVVAVVGLSLFGMVFNLIPVLGQIIQFGIQLFIGSFVLALSTSVLIGLYYRYNEPVVLIHDDIPAEADIDETKSISL